MVKENRFKDGPAALGLGQTAAGVRVAAAVDAQVCRYYKPMWLSLRGVYRRQWEISLVVCWHAWLCSSARTDETMGLHQRL